jgi:hypothetical protein
MSSPFVVIVSSPNLICQGRMKGRGGDEGEYVIRVRVEYCLSAEQWNSGAQLNLEI